MSHKHNEKLRLSAHMKPKTYSEYRNSTREKVLCRTVLDVGMHLYDRIQYYSQGKINKSHARHDDGDTLDDVLAPHNLICTCQYFQTKEIKMPA